MPNITDQFVTSFSELHINAGSLAADVTSSTAATATAAIQNFFTGRVSTITTHNLGDVVAAVSADTVLEVTDTTGTKLYFLLASGTALTASETTLELLLAVSGVSFVSAQVPLVMEIGTLSNEATVIDTPTFGETYRGKLRGQLDGGQLDAQLYWAPRNFVHSLLRDLAETGTALSVGIKWNSDSTATNSEFVVFNSFVSSFGIDTTFDDVAKVSATLVVDGAEHFASDL